MKTATPIKDMGRTNPGIVQQTLYRLNPPITWTDYLYDTERESEHVFVSAANVLFSGPETYIFPCDETGKVTDWGELHGSLKGVLDHEAALETAGYTISKADL